MSFITEKKGTINSKKFSGWKKDYDVGHVYIKKMRDPKIEPWWPTVKSCKTDYNWIFLRIYLSILFLFLPRSIQYTYYNHQTIKLSGYVYKICIGDSADKCKVYNIRLKYYPTN